MDIGLIGYGGVGKALIRLLNDKEKYLKDKYDLSIVVKYIIKSNGGVYDKKGLNLSEIIELGNELENHNKWGKINIDNILINNDIDTLIELTSTDINTGEPGVTHIFKALENNLNVVTGNKGPILLKYKELKELAESKNVKLMIGCTTGGALPSIISGIYDIAGSEIKSIEGILNGTTNYILSEMTENNISYDEALKKAQELGIAELNPELDVEGYDTAIKLLIISNAILESNLQLSDIEISGITKVTKERLVTLKREKKKLKLIGKVENSKPIKAKVELVELNENNSLYSVDYKNKGIVYDTDTLGKISIIGGASGTYNAAASILRDLIIM